jgi:hypothetical protein
MHSVETVKRRRKRREYTRPNKVEIELALYRTGGNALAATRMLGCNWNFIHKYIHAERAKGRKIGRVGGGLRSGDIKPKPPGWPVFGYVDENTPSVPLTEADNMVLCELMGDEMPEITA